MFAAIRLEGIMRLLILFDGLQLTIVILRIVQKRCSHLEGKSSSILIRAAYESWENPINARQRREGDQKSRFFMETLYGRCPNRTKSNKRPLHNPSRIESKIFISLLSQKTDAKANFFDSSLGFVKPKKIKNLNDTSRQFVCIFMRVPLKTKSRRKKAQSIKWKNLIQWRIKRAKRN